MSTSFRQLESRDGQAEEPRGNTDLMEFYNLLRLYNHLTTSTQTGNFHKQLNGTLFSSTPPYSYYWHGSEECLLAPLANSSLSAPAFKLPMNHTFQPQPGTLSLSEAEKGPIIDISSLGDPVALQPEAKKRKRASADKEDEEKPKKVKKEKKAKKEKSEKKRRSSERPSQDQGGSTR